MAYDRQFLKITWLFTIVGTDEVANTSLNYSGGSVLFNAETALAEVASDPGIGQDLTDKMADFLSSGDIRWATYSRLVGVKVAAIGQDGLYIPETAPIVHEDPTPGIGAATGIVPQETVVVSLRSGFTTGVANFGRMYIPHTSFPLAVDSPFATAGATAGIATAADVFVTQVSGLLNTVVTPTLSPMIMTQVDGATSKAVTQVGVGNVVDTQRRRRNRLPETYSFEAL